jgi:hypothetical protein
MTNEEAKTVLGIENGEDVSDRYEEEIFKLIQVFLKDPVIPSLANGRKKKMIHLQEASNFLLEDADISEVNAKPELNEMDFLLDFISEKGWKEFFLRYDRNKAIIRKEIAGSFKANILCFWVDLLVQNEMRYAKRLQVVINPVLPTTEGKLSEHVPVPDLLKECENLLHKEVITEQLESFKNITDNLSIFSLSKEFARIRKLNESF